MSSVFWQRTNNTAHDWQLDVAEALILKLDSLVIAGTGMGKTTPFVLPLLLPQNKSKLVLVISPLLSLQKQQIKTFNQLGMAAVNNETLDEGLLKRLKSHEFQAVFVGPEMLMENPLFYPWIRHKDTLRGLPCTYDTGLLGKTDDGWIELQ